MAGWSRCVTSTGFGSSNAVSHQQVFAVQTGTWLLHKWHRPKGTAGKTPFHMKLDGLFFSFFLPYSVTAPPWGQYKSDWLMDCASDISQWEARSILMQCDSYFICVSEFIATLPLVGGDGFHLQGRPRLSAPLLVWRRWSEAHCLCVGLLQAKWAVVRKRMAKVVFDHSRQSGEGDFVVQKRTVLLSKKHPQ